MNGLDLKAKYNGMIWIVFRYDHKSKWIFLSKDGETHILPVAKTEIDHFIIPEPKK